MGIEVKTPKEIQLDYLDQQQQEQNLNLIWLGVYSTYYGYSTMFEDLFVSAGGILSTVDTTNTTAYHYYSYYNNYLEYLYNEDWNYTHSLTYVLVKTFSNIDDKVPETKNQLRITDYHDYSYCKVKFYYDDATTAEVENSTNSETKVEKTYTNPNPDKIVNTIEIYVKTTDDAERAYEEEDYVHVQRVPSDLIVQIEAQSITANPVAHRVYCHHTDYGDGNITYDVSFDGGATWVADQSLNVKNTSVHGGSSMIIKFNINGTGYGNYSILKDYSIMLYY